MSDYTPPIGNGAPNYMGGWGNTTPTKMAANHIDHIADKAKFALEMLNTFLSGLDSVEKELVTIASAPHPPQSAILLGLAHRIDAYQKQGREVSLKLQQMMTEIDQVTNQIQRTTGSW